jgi:hypothetical protein
MHERLDPSPHYHGRIVEGERQLDKDSWQSRDLRRGAGDSDRDKATEKVPRIAALKKRTGRIRFGADFGWVHR